MKNWKIAVYTIAKNEEQNVDRWVDSMSEADYICVLDTGSTDKTVEKLRARGVIVEQMEIKPWRFDVARNESMKLIPHKADICVSTDLDEVFEPGWANALRRKWTKDKLMMRYYYIFVHSPTGGEDDTFYRDKIHANHPMFKWIFPIHEVLERPKGMKEELIPEVRCHHYQNKETKRGVYLTLMQQEYKENPDNMRNNFLHAREYYIVGDFDNAIKYMEEFARVAPRDMLYEKVFGLSLVGYAYFEKKLILQAKSAFLQAILTSRVFRMPFLGFAAACITQGDYKTAVNYIDQALEIKERFYLFSDEGAAWEDKPHLLMAQCFSGFGKYEEAIKSLDIALQYKPNFPPYLSFRKQLEDLSKKKVGI